MAKHNKARQHGAHARMAVEKRQVHKLPDILSDVVAFPVLPDTTDSTVLPRTTAVRAAATTARVPLTLTATDDDSTDDDDGDVTTAPTATSPTARKPLTTTAVAVIGTALTTTRVTTPRTTTTSLALVSSTTPIVVTPTTTRAVVATTTSQSSVVSTSSSTTLSLSSSSSAVNASSTAAASTSTTSSSNAGVIAGVVIGILVLGAIIGGLAYFAYKKRKRAAEDAAIYPYGGKSDGNDSFGKRNSAYVRQEDEDDGSNSPGFGASEKFAAAGAAAGAGMAGYGAMNMHDNMAGRGVNSYNMPPQQQFNVHQPHMGQDSPNNFNMGPGSMMPPSPQTFRTAMNGSDRYSNASSAPGGGFAPGQTYGMPPQQRSGLPYGDAPMGYPPQQQSMPRFASPEPMGHQYGNMAPIPTSFPANGPSNTHPALLSAAAAAAVPLPSSYAGSDRTSVVSQAKASSRDIASPIPVEDKAAPQPAAVMNPVAEEPEGPFQDPKTEGKIFIVTRIFEPSMPDELVIQPGDKIQIVMTYDDGWCLGVNLTSVSRNGGGQPSKGVFPRDCVEEDIPAPLVSPRSAAAGVPLPDSRAPSRAVESIPEGDEAQEALKSPDDKPLASEPADLHRAPTLPPLDIASSRFSLGERPDSRASGPAAAKRQSRVAVPRTSVIDTDDIYGGVAALSPQGSTFPPNIQVTASPAQLPSSDSKRMSMSVNNFGSSQHIAEYAAHNEKRNSGLDEHGSRLLDEFPSTPRTAQAPTPREMASPALSSSRASLAAPLEPVRKMKRTSSLIASKDADLFLELGKALDGR